MEDNITMGFNVTAINMTSKILSKYDSDFALNLYRCLAVVIIFSNFYVVIFSGLILKKGQQPRSTYMLLGNICLADVIIGVALLIRYTTSVLDVSNPYCILVIGIKSGPKMVSILSIGLIAVDRYIFIIHGLYYRKWVTTVKIRIVILFTWVIGMTLAFLPLTGWYNPNRKSDQCGYVNLYPKPLKLAINITCLLPLIVMPTVYLIILVTALRNIQTFKTAKPPKTSKQNNNSKQSVKENNIEVPTNTNFTTELNVNNLNEIATSSHNLSKINKNNQSRESVYSNISVATETSSIGEENSNEISVESNKTNQSKISRNVSNKKKATTKFQAIMIILLTSGAFFLTWGPLHIAQLVHMYTEDEKQCKQIKKILVGPLQHIGFMNCVFNPIIYVWWNKGFSNFIKSYYKRMCIKLKNK